MKKKINIIIEGIDQTRVLTRDYLSKLKDVDVYKEFQMEGKKFNSVIWEIGHLSMAQNWLLLYLGKGKPIKREWNSLFAMGF